MSEDQGATKGQDNSDATVKADAAIPATPAALSDKELEKVAGGVVIDTRTNAVWIKSLAPNIFVPPTK